MSAAGRNEAMERWLRRDDIAAEQRALRQEKTRLLAYAANPASIPPAENGPGAIVGLWERVEAIDERLTTLANEEAAV